MSLTQVWDELPLDGHGVLPLFAGLGELLKNLIGRRGPSPATALLLQSVETLQAHVTERLDVETADELRGQLDDLLGDPTYRLLRENLLDAMTSEVLREVARGQASSVPDALLRAVGPENHAQLREIVRLQQAAFGAFFQRLASGAGKAKFDAERRSVVATPLWYLTDPTIPAVLKRRLVEAEIGEVCTIAVAGEAASRNRRWVVQQLLGRILDGLYAMLSILNLEGTEFPSDVLPPDMRLDSLVLQAKHVEVQSEREQQLVDARRADADVYPPISADDDDD